MAADKQRATREQIQAAGQTLQSQVLIVMLVFEWLLIGSTWPLWSGQSDFPAVPLFQWIPVSAQDTVVAWIMLSGFLLLTMLYGVSLVCQRRYGVSLVCQRRYGVSLVCQRLYGDSPGRQRLNRASTVIRVATLVLATGLVIVNQHRLQPWHWLFGLSLLSTVLLAAPHSLQVIRVIVATVYIFSALSRVSADIGSGMTGQIAATIFRLVQLPRAAENPDLIFSTAALFAVVEFAIGCGLLWPRFRNVCVVLAVMLHITLITALSPVGLGHHSGVLIWNLMFIFLVPVVFRRMLPSDPSHRVDAAMDTDEQISRHASDERHRKSTMARFLCGMAFVVPASGLFGIADNWISWQLYSPRPEVFGLFVRQNSVTDLPDSLQRFVSQPDPIEDLCMVRLDRWCLAETGSPMYPEDRFQLAIIQRVTQNIKDRADIRVTIDAPNSIQWWKRYRSVLDGRQLPAE